MFKNEIRYSNVVSPNFDETRRLAVDQSQCQDFNKNPAGWLRNDLSSLAAAQTYEQYRVILERLKEFPSKSTIPEDIPLQSAFEQIRPRYVQTENEFADFVGFITQKGFDNVNAAYQAEMAKKIVTPAPTPSPAPAPASADNA